MKTTSAILMLVLFLVIGAGIFLILNRPANLIIRKTFKAIAGYEIVSSKDYDAIKASNKALEQAQEESRVRAQGYIEALAEVTARAQEAEKRADAMRISLVHSNIALEQARVTIKYLHPTESVQLYDENTEGLKESYIFESNGEPYVATELSRVVSANVQIEENRSRAEQIQMYQRLLEECQIEVDNYKRGVAIGEGYAKELLGQLSDKDAQIAIWKDSHTKAIAKGQKWFIGGVGLTAANLLLIILIL
jgi:hypothetical protein